MEHFSVKSNREEWIDALKGLAIFLVVLGHCGKSTYYSTIYYIHLPTFIIVSGYLMGVSQSWKKKGLWDNTKKKAADLLYPYLTFGFLLILQRFIKSACTGTTFNLNNWLRLILFLENSSNWFLPPLFLSEIIFIAYALVAHKKHIKLHCIMSMGISVVITVICRRLIYATALANPDATTALGKFAYRSVLLTGKTSSFLFFLNLGYLIFTCVHQRHILKKTAKILLSCLCLVVLVFVIRVTQPLPIADLHFIKWRSSVGYFLLGSLGACSLLFLFKLLNIRFKLLRVMGRDSLIINGTHDCLELVKFSRLALSCIIGSDVYKIYSQDLASALCATMVCFIVLVFLCPILKKAFPFILHYSVLRESVMPYLQDNHTIHDQKVRPTANLRFKFLSLIGILGVVCSHIGSTALAPDRLFIYNSYYMAMFAFISGYFFRPPQSPKQATKKIVSKLRKHLLPLVCWTAVYMLFFVVIRSNTSIPTKIGYSSIKVNRIFIDPFLWGTGAPGLAPAINVASWFVGTFIVLETFNLAFYSILPDRQKSNLGNLIFFTVLAAVAVNFSKLDSFNALRPYSVIFTRSAYLMLWYNVGYYYHLYFEKWEQKVPDAVLFLVTTAGYLLISCSRFLRDMSMATNVYGGIFDAGLLETVFTAAVAILFWLRVSKFAEPVMKMTKLPRYIADHTFDIMMHHGFCFWLINLAIYFISFNSTFVAEKFNYDTFAKTPWYAFVPGTTLAPIRLVYIAFAVALPLTCRWIYEKAKKKLSNRTEKVS